MDLNQRIEYAIEGIASLMLSSGPWPFTVVPMVYSEFESLTLQSALNSTSQILVLLKSDYTEADMINYAKNSKEYLLLPKQSKQSYLDMFSRKFNDPLQFKKWIDMNVGIAMGLVMHIAKRVDVYLAPVEEVLTEIGELPQFTAFSLSPYQLFNAYLLD